MTVILLRNPHNLGANHANAKAAFNITSSAYTHILLYCSIPDTSESGAKAKTENKNKEQKKRYNALKGKENNEKNERTVRIEMVEYFTKHSLARLALFL